MGPVNKSIFEKFLLRIKIVVKTFSIFDKLFSKLVYYFVPLGHILVKSIINLVIFVFVCPAIVLFIYLLKLNIVGDFTKMNIENA